MTRYSAIHALLCRRREPRSSVRR